MKKAEVVLVALALMLSGCYLFATREHVADQQRHC